jgi:hypothetical protein
MQGAAKGGWVKTVFLFLRQGISNRNLLRTDFLKTLKENPGVRIVIISPIGEEPGFRDEFQAARVCVENWPATKVGFWERRLKNLKDYIWVSRGLTQAIRVRRLAERGKWGLAWRDALGRLAKCAGISEQNINDVELAMYKSRPPIARLYDRYQPDLVVFTRLFGTNLHVIKEAKQRRIPVLCLVESWDNLICKGPLSVVPDSMVVWNQEMIREANELHGFPCDKVHVVGVPQFDLYANVAHYMERKAFFAAHALDPDRKLITYAASTEGIARNEPGIVEVLYRMVQQKRLGRPAQILVRLHPITSTELQREYCGRFANRPHIVIQKPGRTAALHDGWDPTWSDMLMLGSTLRHSDVVVNVASTMSIDAAALDKPIVCVAFEEEENGTNTKHLEAIFYHSHYRKLVDTKALRLVFSEDELAHAVSEYLNEPSLDAAGRARLREELCYRLDGHSARRAALRVLREMGAHLPGTDRGEPEQSSADFRSSSAIINR